MNIRHLLNKTATITRDTVSSDGAGGNIRTPVVIATVLIKIDASRGRDDEVAIKDVDKVSHVAYVEAGIDVLRDDIVTESGQEYKVLSLLPPSAPDHLKLLLEIL